MATAEQIKALLNAYFDENEEHFISIAMQVAAQEARIGHRKIANELHNTIEKGKVKKNKGLVAPLKTIPISQLKGELSTLLTVNYPKLKFMDMVLDAVVLDKLSRVVKEQKYQQKIQSHGLIPRKKILMVGPPGTGKTMSATVLAGELQLPLFVVRLDSLITKFMGETASKLRLIFDYIHQVRGVYFFDEFDSIGSKRGMDNDVGEIRRVLNSFLQFIEQDKSPSILLAATNHPKILDEALFRRFDDIVVYGLPSVEQIEQLLKYKLVGVKKSKNINYNKLAEVSNGLSYADITSACEDAIKEYIINNKTEVLFDDIEKSIFERKKDWK